MSIEILYKFSNFVCVFEVSYFLSHHQNNRHCSCSGAEFLTTLLSQISHDVQSVIATITTGNNIAIIYKQLNY